MLSSLFPQLCKLAPRQAAAARCIVPLLQVRPNSIVCTQDSSQIPLGVAGVSSHGRVRSKHGVITWGCRSDLGYRCTWVGGRYQLVHRLVARVFLGSPPSQCQRFVNHKDRNKSNNHISNLEYVTQSENILHSYRTNPDRKTSAEATSKPILGRHVGKGS